MWYCAIAIELLPGYRCDHERAPSVRGGAGPVCWEEYALPFAIGNRYVAHSGASEADVRCPPILGLWRRGEHRVRPRLQFPPRLGRHARGLSSLHLAQSALYAKSRAVAAFPSMYRAAISQGAFVVVHGLGNGSSCDVARYNFVLPSRGGILHGGVYLVKVART